MNFKLSCFVFLFSITLLSAQKSEFSSLLIPDSLKHNANAVVRLDQIDILITSQRSMTIKNKRVVTVLNEYGLSAVHLQEFYSKETTVKNIQTTFLDAFGNLIKKIKKKDFTDYCATDGGTVFSDSRVLFYNYTPINYPFTAVYESEVETSTTAFIPQWQPLHADLVSLEKCILNVNYPNNLGFKKKEFNFRVFRNKSFQMRNEFIVFSNIISFIKNSRS